jgi:hypothetical protein
VLERHRDVSGDERAEVYALVNGIHVVTVFVFHGAGSPEAHP